MGNCIYCGKPAGFLNSEHQQCKTRNQKGLQYMILIAKEAAYSGEGLSTLLVRLNDVAQKCFIPSSKIRETIICGFAEATKKALKDKVVDINEESALISYKNLFSLSQEELDTQNQSYIMLVKSLIIRDVSTGVPPNVIIDSMDELPVFLQKDERISWIFKNTKLFEYKSHTHYEGSSAGMSFRVMKGVSFRTSSFSGYPVRTTSLDYIDGGDLLVTNQGLYFSGNQRKFRIKYKDILELDQFSDAIGVTKNIASGRPQVFGVDDGWFAYHLISNLAK